MDKETQRTGIHLSKMVRCNCKRANKFVHDSSLLMNRATSSRWEKTDVASYTFPFPIPVAVSLLRWESANNKESWLCPMPVWSLSSCQRQPSSMSAASFLLKSLSKHAFMSWTLQRLLPLSEHYTECIQPVVWQARKERRGPITTHDQSKFWIVIRDKLNILVPADTKTMPLTMNKNKESQIVLFLRH